MPRDAGARLRVLAVGIRPTFAAECGVPPRGTVDILDAHGISGWQIGIRQLVSEAAGPGGHDRRLLDWGRAELEADAVRWHQLAAFVTTLRRAAELRSAARHDIEEARLFWRGWYRNLAHARSLLVSANLVVSPFALAVLHDVGAMVRREAGALAGGLPELMAHLREEASARLSPEATDPPPLVLPAHRSLLTAILSSSPP